MTDELIPDNPHLKQIDTLFRQMAYSRKPGQRILDASGSLSRSDFHP
jgi:hypothetical protein